MMNTVRYDSAIAERKGKRKQRRKEEKGCFAEVDTSGFENICVYVCVGVYVYLYARLCIHVYVLVVVYKFNTIVVSFTFAYIYMYIYIVLQLIVDTAINVPGCAKERSVSLEISSTGG